MVSTAYITFCREREIALLDAGFLVIVNRMNILPLWKGFSEEVGLCEIGFLQAGNRMPTVLGQYMSKFMFDDSGKRTRHLVLLFSAGSIPHGRA